MSASGPSGPLVSIYYTSAGSKPVQYLLFTIPEMDQVIVVYSAYRLCNMIRS